MSVDRPPPQPLIGSTIRLAHLGSPLIPRLSDPRRIGASGRERGKGKKREKLETVLWTTQAFPSGTSRVSVPPDYRKQPLASIADLSSLLSILPLRPILNFCLSSYSLPGSN
ncbi:hypothetical protein ACN42_g2560 [Penicillium freii]|uniref:Uncharacterized protein n=1 Tax=Penicillium freii TaxID=48697 RepID=A0A101MPW6_PENFR|nr:hypothetical protein ACN42_g2560 [Penicillium freii]